MWPLHLNQNDFTCCSSGTFLICSKWQASHQTMKQLCDLHRENGSKWMKTLCLFEIPFFTDRCYWSCYFFKWTVLSYFIVVRLGENILESLFRRMKIRNEGKIAACSFYRQSSNQSQVFIFALYFPNIKSIYLYSNMMQLQLWFWRMTVNCWVLIHSCQTTKLWVGSTDRKSNPKAMALTLSGWNQRIYTTDLNTGSSP